MRRWVTLVAASLAAFAAGCGDDATGPGSLVVREVWTDGPFFVEGHVSFVSVRRAGGKRVAERRVGPEGGERLLLERRVPAGDYRIGSYVRSCAGNCDLLDPPSGRCTAEAEVPPGGRLVVSFVRSHDEPECRVTVD